MANEGATTVTVKLRADVAASIGLATPTSDQRATPGPAENVIALLTEHGADIAAMHPSTTDPELQTWFLVDVADATSATGLASSLVGVDGVEAAYVQPPAELP